MDLGNVFCKAVQFSEGDAVTSAVMASTVDHVWNDRGRKDAVDRVQASSVASLACSCPCKKRRRWRSMQTGPSNVYVAISWPARSSCCCCFSWRSLWWLLGGGGAAACGEGRRGGLQVVVVLLLVDDEEEDMAVEEEREVITRTAR